MAEQIAETVLHLPSKQHFQKVESLEEIDYAGDPPRGDSLFFAGGGCADGSNWYVYCNNNPLRYTDPTGLRIIKEEGETTEEVKEAQIDKIIAEHEHPDKPITQKEYHRLLGGDSGCHFLSLVRKAEIASEENFNIYALNKIRMEALDSEAIKEDYSVQDRNKLLQISFDAAGEEGVKPYWDFNKEGAKSSILKGTEYYPQNRAMVINDFRAPWKYHFKSGNTDGSVESDPWYGSTTQIEAYKPYGVYYYVHW